MSKRSSFGSFFTSLLLIAVVTGVAATVFLQRQTIVDQVQVWQYEPSPEIAALADRTTMNDHGRHLYYVAHPSLENADVFNTHCERREGDSPILGCYRDGKIYIFDVQDERLEGIEEVTAAHEMLHVAFERLNEDEQTRIGALLETEYKKHANDDLTARMQYYERTQPGQRINELHSIIGTEKAEISSELEEYYANYFDDRSAIIALFNGYNGRFVTIREEAAALRTELEGLEASIDQQTEAYNRALQVLNRDIETFNSRAEAGDFTSQGQFDTERSALIARSQTIENQRAGIEQSIDVYNEKQRYHNSLVDESNSLRDSLDSNLAPAPQLQGMPG